MMQKNNEALLQYVEEIKNLRNLILNELSQADNSQGNQMAAMNLPQAQQ